MREPAGNGARLLVVDDNKVNRLLLTRSLEQQGHSVDSAENGRVALEKLRRERFDLVLLDMEMPEMNGFQVLEQLVADLQLRDLPVLVTSSLEGIDNVARCIELGAEDFLTKPVNPVLLKARIGASLEKKRLRDQQKELVRRFATPEVAQDLQQSGFALGTLARELELGGLDSAKAADALARLDEEYRRAAAALAELRGG